MNSYFTHGRKHGAGPSRSIPHNVSVSRRCKMPPIIRLIAPLQTKASQALSRRRISATRSGNLSSVQKPVDDDDTPWRHREQYDLNARSLAPRWNCKRLDKSIIQISTLPALQRNHVTLTPTLRVGAFAFVFNDRQFAGGCSAGTVVGSGRSIAAASFCSEPGLENRRSPRPSSFIELKH